MTAGPTAGPGAGAALTPRTAGDPVDDLAVDGTAVDDDLAVDGTAVDDIAVDGIAVVDDLRVLDGGSRGPVVGPAAAAQVAPALAPTVLPGSVPPSGGRRPDRVLYPVPTVQGPHGRLGLLWFVGVMAAAAWGEGPVALWFAVTAALAAHSVDPTRADAPAALPPWVVPAGAAGLPLTAVGGARGLTIGAVLVVLGLLGGRLLERRTGPDALELTARAAAVILTVGLASATPVLAAGLGTGVVLGLLAMASAYDAGAYLVGVGAGHPWEGPVAGIAGVAVVGFALAVLNAFGVGAEDTWLVTAAAAALFPLGPPVATALAGDGRRVPVLRRLDVLLVAGPVWIWVIAGLG